MLARVISLGVLLFALAAGGLNVAQAAAPRQPGQAPGFYRMMVGDIEVTALNDGTDMLPAGMLFKQLGAKDVDALLARAYLKNPVETSFNAFLVNNGAKLVLIDTGGGALGDDAALGHLSANLRAAGYQPGQVDEVYITHMHWDHIGGLLSAGQRAFPNAIVRAAKAEADHWLSPTLMAAAPKEQQDTFKRAIEMLKPYIDAGRFSPFEGDVALAEGITARSTPGHTPGHTSYLVQSRGEKLLVIGDLVHVAAVQFPRPQLLQVFDSDPQAGAAQRVRVYAEAAAGGYWIAGAHLSFPGLGHLRAEGAGYRWVPVNYSTRF